MELIDDGRMEAQGSAPEIASNTSDLQRAIISAMNHIEAIEADIADRRHEIKDAVESLRKLGVHPQAIAIARKRRKLAADGSLGRIDRSTEIICRIRALGIQGELLEWS